MTSASLATNCKPAVGYATRGAACIALKAQGKTWGEIARILDMKDGRVASALALKTKQRAERSVRAIKLNGNVFLDLEREARRRDLTADQLALKLLHTIIVEKLYGAVLDD